MRVELYNRMGVGVVGVGLGWLVMCVLSEWFGLCGVVCRAETSVLMICWRDRYEKCTHE